MFKVGKKWFQILLLELRQTVAFLAAFLECAINLGIAVRQIGTETNWYRFAAAQ